MTYVVTDACIKCKYTDCVEVCPVDAIYPEESLPEGQAHFLQINAELAKTWDYITEPKDPLPDADEWADVANKLEHLDRG